MKILRFISVCAAALALAACSTGGGQAGRSHPATVVASATPSPAQPCKAAPRVIKAVVQEAPDVYNPKDEEPPARYRQLLATWQNPCPRTPDMFCWAELVGPGINYMNGMMVMAQDNICQASHSVGWPTQPFKLRVGFSNFGTPMEGTVELTCPPEGDCK